MQALKGQYNARQDNAIQAEIRQGKEGHDKTRQNNNTRQYYRSQYNIRQDKSI